MRSTFRVKRGVLILLKQLFFPEELMERLGEFLEQYAQPLWWYTALVRFVFPLLAAVVLVRAFRGLLRMHSVPECWGQLALPGGGSIPISHWENIVGRAPLADIRLDFPTISRQHAVLVRGENGNWSVTDLGSKGGTQVNGVPIGDRAPVRMGDTLTVGGIDLLFLPQTREELAALHDQRRSEGPVSMWSSLICLTLIQVMAAFQILIGNLEEAGLYPLMLPALSAVMWIYCLVMRGLGSRGFELETIAFFLCTLSISVTLSSVPAAAVKQLVAIVLGIFFLVVLEVWMREPGRIQKMRWLMAALAIGLLMVTVVLGQTKYGAANWIILGPFSFQPSEIAKIFYIFAGAAGLERLFRKRNLWLFMVLTGVCLLCLAKMSDFGTASIFFATFLIIAFLRSGDFATLALICGGALFAGGIVLQFKPYILSRFASWGHAWEAASTTGYQQTRTMSAAASGGLIGVGPGNGWLQKVGAADTDLVFGILCEEWGLIIAVFAVLSILVLAVFAVKACRMGRSAFLSIAACAAGSLLVVQTMLNVFGSMDLLPLTGVTFPFVSNGGSAMIASWGLLAFLKAADTREKASFAVKASKVERKGGAQGNEKN